MDLKDRIRGLELIKDHIAEHYHPQYELMVFALSETIKDLKTKIKRNEILIKTEKGLCK